MSEILLATINARYIHTAFGLRCLYANLGKLQERCTILEFDSKQRAADIAEELLAAKPKIIGLGVYIWNVVLTTEVVGLLKQLAPDVRVVLGGPEVSYETASQEIVRLADHVITGEADQAFADLCCSLLAGATQPKVLAAALPALAKLASPYPFYQDEDLAHRVLYVEASRGCPFSCEFCLSSVDLPVRAFPLPAFLSDMEQLLVRGARQFKFLDRTFNLDVRVSAAILEFFLERWQPGLFLHFEMIPDRFPEALRGLICKFPAGALQFEVGIQSFNDEVANNISRRQNVSRLEDNLRFLKAHSGVHVHADLIAGLPGENLVSFAAGFDRLWRLGPQEIQVGILKRLRGTPIIRHDQPFAMIYSPLAPYELLANCDLDFATLQQVKRFARHWDALGNSGRFSRTLPMLLDQSRHASPFWNFWEFSQHLHARMGKQQGISPANLAGQLWLHLREAGVDPAALESALTADHLAAGGRGRPTFFAPEPAAPRATLGANRRQQRHQQPAIYRDQES
ncbi:MAG: B12-binding domain-containing radical SAM protein [Verrucomicrobia bacterium]|nr:MAG: B12-binding domain-containing radical SAM protein [Verrucomicrobiota bacterium]